MQELAPIVSIVNDQPRAMSTDVAEFFDKQHGHVLRDIREIMANCSESFSASNFGLADYLDGQGKSRPAYSMTRDGFTLLAMGFTGEKALQFKLAYIEAFNRMEAELKKPAKPRRSDSELNARSAAVSLRMMARLKCYPETMKGVLLAHAANLTAGLPLAALLPPVADSRETWLSPTAMGEVLGGVFPVRVGRALKALLLHGESDPEHKWSQPLWDKSPHSNKEVVSFIYDPAVVLPALKKYFEGALDRTLATATV